MQFSIDKAKTAAVITIALMIASVTLMALPIQPVKAQISGTIGTTPSNIYGYPNLGPLPSGVTPQNTWETRAYMSITPNPIGVGQQVLVNVWSSPGQPHYLYMQGYKVTIQKPDGTTDVIGPFNSYLADDSGWFQYVVDQVGTWKFKFESPGTYVPAGYYYARPGEYPPAYPDAQIGTSIYYTASSTDWQELTVQQDWINSWPSVPLPTDYWTRPISIENREWYSIGGHYPWSGAVYYPNGRVLYASNYKYTAYVQAPNTAHIVWRRQGALAGLIGGETYQYSAYTGGGNPSIVYAGRCYQTLTKPMLTLINGTYRTQPVTVWECYDLRTGQVYWDLTDVTAPTNILYEPPTPAASGQMVSSGGYSVSLVAISGSRLIKYNPLTGAVSLNISLPLDLSSGVTSGTQVVTSPGSIYNNEWVWSVQTLNASKGYNYFDTRGDDFRFINWSMRGSSTNFTSRIGSNITWPLARQPMQGQRKGVVFDWDAGIACVGTMEFDVSFGPNNTQNPNMQTQFGTSAWNIGYNMTTFNLRTGTTMISIGANDTIHTVEEESNIIVDRGKIAWANNVNRMWVCFDARTGKHLWDSDLAAYPWGNWWAYSTQSYDFNESKGAIIATSYAGVYAFDWDTGHILWFYRSSMPPFESPYGDEPFFAGCKTADGKVYAYGAEHTTTQPVTRGWHIHCINATTGKLIWKMTGAMSPGAIADGYLTASDSNDGYMYVFGKGKSATTVTAGPKTIAKGDAALIEGTVMDMSPGDQGSVTNPTARPDSPTKPGTVPCVSVASMETLMEYLYMQHPIDGLYHNETITGVPVILTAIGSKGNVINIGTTTTNGYYGTFGMAWTPPDEDTYTITANFAGSDSYGSSAAATSLVVGPAPASPTPTPEQPQAQPDNTPMYVLGATIAIIIALAIATLLILRKRP